MKIFTRKGWTLLLSAAVVMAIVAQTGWAQQHQNYMGSGGKEISLTIYVPQSIGLAKEQNYIPALVQGEFVSNFSNYSAVSILDWERLDDIYVKLVNEAYDDKAAAKQDVVLGRLAPTSHFLTGNITKTAKGYNIKMNITATADKITTATYSGTFSFAELDNLTGIRRASLELLQKIGVELTEKARQELAGAAEANQISAQTALAKGVTAQRQGTEVEALSYYYQAASFNPKLAEALKRSSVLAANISSGNIGADIRNDIVWRKNWVAKLKETEETFHKMINAADPPYTLFYSTNIRTGKVSYQTETAELSVITDLSPNLEWFGALGRTIKAAQAVLDGLNTTKRKKDWDLAEWPIVGVSSANPFVSSDKYSKQYDIAVTFELINEKGRVIGNQTVKLNTAFGITRSSDQIIVNYIGNQPGTVKFNRVKAGDISTNMAIRVSSVNGLPPQKARFTIAAMPAERQLIDTRNGKKYNTVKMYEKTWMAENLNYETGNSRCYDDDESNCDKYGRLYDWNTAKTACPSGWHLPKDKEWKRLELVASGGNDPYRVNIRLANKRLKSTSGWDKYENTEAGLGYSYGQEVDGNGTDDYGFSALPGGYYGTYRSYGSNSYMEVGTYGKWWTASCGFTCSSAYIKEIKTYNNDGGVHDVTVGSRYYSVRCVRDD